MTNKRISPFTLGSLAGLNLLLYGFFISKYIQNIHSYRFVYQKYDETKN